MTAIGLALMLFWGCGDTEVEPEEPCQNCEQWELDEDQARQLQACAPSSVEGEDNFIAEIVDRQWEGDRLVGRDALVTSSGVEHFYETHWEYDEDGRMQSATTYIDGTKAAVSEWTYDEERPVEVERRLRGMVVEAQSWSYEDGQLVGRQAQFTPRGEEGSGELADFTELRYAIELHDDYSLRFFGRSDENLETREFHSLWEDANAHLDVNVDDDCYRLPASAGHGYPEDDHSYHLGLNTDYAATLSQIIYDYNYNGFNPQAWYGHLGVATGWPYDTMHVHDRPLSMALKYDEEGRMVGEEIDYQNSSRESVAAERVRSFNERGLSEDVLVVEHQGESAEALLRFERDEDDNLISRERLQNGELASRQEWTYEDGKAQSVEVYLSKTNPTVYTPNPPLDELLDKEAPSSLEHVATFERGGDE